MAATPPPAPSPRPQRKRRRRAQSNSDRTPYRHRNQAVHIPEGYMAVGRIVGAHGLTGECRMELHTDFPDRFAPGVTILLGAALHPYTIERARAHKGMMLLMLAEVSERNAAEELRNEWVFIPDASARSLPAGEYWVHDIIGLAVVDETGRPIGTVIDVLQTGANDVYILTPAGNVNRGKELLIPAIADVVQRVDVAQGTMTIRLIPGLLDE